MSDLFILPKYVCLKSFKKTNSKGNNCLNNKDGENIKVKKIEIIFKWKNRDDKIGKDEYEINWNNINKMKL